MLLVHISVAYLPVDWKMRGHVDEIVVELDHVLEAGIDRGKRVFQVLERLRRLSSEFARCAGELASGITPRLTGDVNSAVTSITWV